MNIQEVFEYNQHFVIMMNIINYSRKFPPENGHKHHIIPKCWFKHNNLEIDNSEENIVLLSYENHAKVHKLAYLCAKTPYMRSAMALAAHRLDKDVINCPYIFTAEHRQKISKANKGRKMSEETKKKMSEADKGRPGFWKGKHLTEEAKRKISLNNGNRTKEARARVSKQFKGKPNPHRVHAHWKLVDGRRVWYD